jgi:hypothetical protein
MEHQRAGIQMESQLSHDADDEHQSREEDTGRAVESELQKLRYRKYFCPDVIRKQESAGNTEANAGCELDSTCGQAIPVRIPGQANQVFRTYVGGKQRRPDNRPAEPSASQEILGTRFAGALPYRNREANRNTGYNYDAAYYEVKRR